MAAPSAKVNSFSSSIYKRHPVYVHVMYWWQVLAILPEGSVRNEGVFLILVAGLAILVSIAIYLRYKRNKEPDWPTQ